MTGVILKLVNIALGVLTPEIIKMIQEGIKKAHEAAKETDNPFDDLITGFLCDLLNIQK
jgi:hypothetical protein